MAAAALLLLLGRLGRVYSMYLDSVKATFFKTRGLKGDAREWSRSRDTAVSCMC